MSGDGLELLSLQVTSRVVRIRRKDRELEAWVREVRNH
jgi:hypothetical protein